jgi:hypothetical protein
MHTLNPSTPQRVGRGESRRQCDPESTIARCDGTPAPAGATSLLRQPLADIGDCVRNVRSAQSAARYVRPARSLLIHFRLIEANDPRRRYRIYASAKSRDVLAGAEFMNVCTADRSCSSACRYDAVSHDCQSVSVASERGGDTQACDRARVTTARLPAEFRRRPGRGAGQLRRGHPGQHHDQQSGCGTRPRQRQLECTSGADADPLRYSTASRRPPTSAELFARHQQRDRFAKNRVTGRDSVSPKCTLLRPSDCSLRIARFGLLA